MSGREAYWGGKRKKTPLSTLKLVEPSKDKWYYSQPFSLEGNKVSFSSTFRSCCRSSGEVVLPVNSLTLKIKCSFTVSGQQERFTYKGKQVKFCAHKNVLASALGGLLQAIANPGKPAQQEARKSLTISATVLFEKTTQSRSFHYRSSYRISIWDKEEITERHRASRYQLYVCRKDHGWVPN